jgi:hypothetical protein
VTARRSHILLVGSDQRRDPKGPDPQLFLFALTQVLLLRRWVQVTGTRQHLNMQMLYSGVCYMCTYMGETQGRVRRCAVSNWGDGGEERIGINVHHTV